MVAVLAQVDVPRLQEGGVQAGGRVTEAFVTRGDREQGRRQRTTQDKPLRGVAGVARVTLQVQEQPVSLAFGGRRLPHQSRHRRQVVPEIRLEGHRPTTGIAIHP